MGNGDDPEACKLEVGVVREALYKIKSPNLRRVAMKVEMALWSDPFPKTWVSPFYSIAAWPA